MEGYNEVSFDDWDEKGNKRAKQETEFSKIVSRRLFLGGSVALGASAFLLSTSALVSTKAQAAIMSNGNKFKAVMANSLDTITLPDGFKWQVVAQWGDPLFSNVPEFNHATRGTAASQALSYGDNNDGMDLFQIDGANVLVVNNEYTNRGVMFGYNKSGLPESVEDINKLLNCGADKVSINTAAVENSKVVIDSSKKFGSQCIVVAIDAKKNGDKWEVFTHGGRNNSGIDALEYAEQMEKNGAGELLVTSMDRDGTQVGYDIDLMSKISSKVNIPVIASGGVGNLDHLVDGIKLGNASAVLAASIFHYGKHSVKEAKDYLDSKGIPVRI